MTVTRDEIVKNLQQLLGDDNVIIDEQVLKENSHDRFYKLPSAFGIYTLPLPAAVVKVQSSSDVAAVLTFCNDNGVNVVPRTGGSATEGGLETIVENSVVMDGSDMNKILSIDAENMQATVQCGVPLEVLDDRCREQGLTVGHSPQSKPLAQYGGLVATRSIGQFSTLYGGIEDMVIGLEAVFPNGKTVRIKNVPRRACGPDIRHIVIGNEGALCFITEVTVKLFTWYPDNNQFLGYALDDMKTGFELLRKVMVAGYRPSVARLYDAEDGRQHGFDQFVGERCLLLFMAEGPERIARATAEGIDEIVTGSSGLEKVEPKRIENWFNNLNWGPEKIAEEEEYIKKTLTMGFTTEVSGSWSIINAIYENSLRRIREEFPAFDDLTMLGGHSSHSYQTGTNMYFVYDYKVRDCTYEEEMNKYHVPLNAIIVEETLKAGGSMVHHHGIGKHRTPWTREEHGSAYCLLEGLKKAFDPQGIMNKGTVFPLD